jgi:hypothetical protein
VVTFDTTYRTNQYNLPFGLFVGVNNHFQSIMFGGVLLTTEKVEDFEWAFSKFAEIMGGKQPHTILTGSFVTFPAILVWTPMLFSNLLLVIYICSMHVYNLMNLFCTRSVSSYGCGHKVYIPRAQSQVVSMACS